MKQLFFVTLSALIFSIGANADTVFSGDICQSGTIACLGCPPPQGCTTCHGGDNGNFWAMWGSQGLVCGCSCTYVSQASIPELAKRAQKTYDPKWTDYGQKFLASLKAGLPFKLFSVFEPPTISVKGEFLNAHIEAAKQIETECGRRTINRIMQSGYLK